jgi:chemosensory pili system protein ChpA (sensor histidine kinase/response regulator)
VRPDERRTIDRALLGDFIDEAQRALQNIRECAARFRDHPANLEALAAIRRSYHILKNSSDMVGLVDFSDVSAAMERPLDRWLDEKLRGSESLFGLIDDSQSALEHFTQRLRSNATATLNKSQLISAAHRVHTGELQSRAHSRDGHDTDKPDVGLVNEEAPEVVIQVGEISLSEKFYEVFLAEASQHIDTLQRHHGQLANGSEEPVRFEFVRAAHTLGGIGRTAGFTAIAELGQTLEGWLQDNLDHPRVLNAQERELLGNAIATLAAMIGAIVEKVAPGGASALVAALTRSLTQINHARNQVVEPAGRHWLCLTRRYWPKAAGIGAA